MSSFQQKNYETCKETAKCDPFTGKKIVEIIPKEVQMLDLLDKYFKHAIVNMFKNWMKTCMKN